MAPLVIPLLKPRDGTVIVGHTPEEFAAAAARINAGRGPIAIDTERANEFVYDDRAFLLQLRRQDAGTILLAPDHDPQAFRAKFSWALDNQDWVLHAAASDLPALYALGVRPRTLFDTELAGRLAGFPRVNLGALVAEVLGYQLEKGHSDENWSTWPLPDSWINYAALDVELLLELRDALTEILDSQGKLEFANQEFEHIMRGPHELSAGSWDSLKGIGKLKLPRQRQVARALWLRRDALAKEFDLAANHVLSSKALVELAASSDIGPEAIERIIRINASRLRRYARLSIPRQARPSAKQWHRTILDAVAEPVASWPESSRVDLNEVPAPRSQWSRSFPEAQEALQQVRVLIDALSAESSIPSENLLQPSALRELVWHSAITRKVKTTAELEQLMVSSSVRPWQIELTLPLLSSALFGQH